MSDHFGTLCIKELKPLKAGSVNGRLVLTYVKSKSLVSLEMYQRYLLGIGWNGLENCVKNIILKISATWTKVVVFLKHFLLKALHEKEKKCKDGKKSKQKMAVAFFFSADGGKVGKPLLSGNKKNTLL